MFVVPESDVVNGRFEKALHETGLDQQLLASLGESSTSVRVNLFAQCAIERIQQQPPAVSSKQIIQISCELCGHSVKARIGDRPADLSISS